jgi:predicted DNA-binding protein (MmcQ/YjbR family)
MMPTGYLVHMDKHELKTRCLGLPGAGEEFPFGDEVSVFKVGGKMFALSHLDGEPLQLSVKCDPELAAQLRSAYPAITPGYHLNKRHWNTITLDGSVPDEMVTDMLGDSYDLVVASLPKARRPLTGFRSGGSRSSWPTG